MPRKQLSAYITIQNRQFNIGFDDNSCSGKRHNRLQHSCLGKRLYEPSAKLNLQNSCCLVPHRSIALRLCRHSDGDIILFFKIFVHKEVFKLLTNISFCSYLFIYISQFFVKFHKEHVRIIIFFTDISHRTIIIVFTS